MTESPAGLDDHAIEAWTRWCDTLERTGTTVLREMLTADAIDVAEGLRHLERMSTLALFSACENLDDAHPYFWTALDPHRKMGGDNPQGLYLSAPINGTDVFVVRGPRGSARWFSAIVQRSPAARLAGAPLFGDGCSSPICAWMRTVASNSSSPPRGTDRTGCEPTSTRRRCSCGSSSVLPTMWSSWNWRSRT